MEPVHAAVIIDLVNATEAPQCALLIVKGGTITLPLKEGPYKLRLFRIVLSDSGVFLAYPAHKETGLAQTRACRLTGEFIWSATTKRIAQAVAQARFERDGKRVRPVPFPYPIPVLDVAAFSDA